MIDFKTLDMLAEDGTSLKVNVPAGPLPTPERVAVLAAAFDRVKNSDHWKGPIYAYVNVAELSELTDIAEAVEFYTATEATFSKVSWAGRLPGARLKAKATVLVTAPGYWAGPAN